MDQVPFELALGAGDRQKTQLIDADRTANCRQLCHRNDVQMRSRKANWPIRRAQRAARSGQPHYCMRHIDGIRRRPPLANYSRAAGSSVVRPAMICPICGIEIDLP